MRLRLLALLLVLVAGAGVALYVTRRPEKPPPTAAEVYEAAAAAGTARVTIAYTLGPEGGTPILRATSTGVADLRGGRASVRIAFDNETNTFRRDSYDAVTTRETAYLKGDGGWVSHPLAEDVKAQVATQAPEVLLRYLRDTGATWAYVADETVDGRSLRRFRGTTPYLGGVVDAWVDGRSRPVRVDVAHDGGLDHVRARYRLDLTDFGAAVMAEPPKEARPVADVSAAFEAVGL